MILNFNRLDYTSPLRDQITAALKTVSGLHPEQNKHLVMDASGNLYHCIRMNNTSRVWHVSRC